MHSQSCLAKPPEDTPTNFNIMLNKINEKGKTSKMKSVLLIICLATTMAANAEYYPATAHKVFGFHATTADESAIDQLMIKLWDSWSRHDATTFANLHSEDAEWTNAFGRTYIGSDELENFLEHNLFAGFDIEIAEKEAEFYSEISRRYIGSDSAVVTGRTESNRGSSVGSSNRKIGFTFVLGKIDGEWKITNQVITDIREIRR